MAALSVWQAFMATACAAQVSAVSSALQALEMCLVKHAPGFTAAYFSKGVRAEHWRTVSGKSCSAAM